MIKYMYNTKIMIEEKQNKICNLIDFLFNIKVEDTFMIKDAQKESLSNIQSNIKYIQDEGILDTILLSINKTMQSLSNRINKLNNDIVSIEREYVEKIERYEETKEVEWLFKGI